jgi:dihydrofolate synthase/folylpolyglutamate synthase
MDKGFTKAAEVFEWISRFINQEREPSPNSFRLDRMEFLTRVAGHPERRVPAIHVAGSKGKGSVTGMLTAVLQAAGYRPARYMSPHVSDYRERVMLGDRFFDDEVYIAAGDELRAIVESLKERGSEGRRIFYSSADNRDEPTHFELITLFFFLCARVADCDIMVVEVGLGGRLDATNVLVDPVASVINVIELEHTEYLGDTLAAVAGEKGGIIKADRPVFLAAQEDEALEVFRRIASERGAPLHYLRDEAEIGPVTLDRGGSAFTVKVKGRGELRALLAVPGEIQAQNAALAVLTLKAAFPSIDDGVIQKGLAAFHLPARFERIMDDPILIIDGAHTERSAASCAATFTALYGEGGLLLFGCAAGKNIHAMARALLPHFSAVVITTPGTFKASDPQGIWEVFLSEAGDEGPPIRLIRDTAAAVEALIALGRERGLPVLVVGSFYLAAEVRNHIIKTPGIRV